jgi:hypothetical protein
MRLAELQREFRAWVVSASEETADRFGCDARAGLSVYQNNYRAQLVGCLESSFPQVRAWMGEEAFLYAQSATSTSIRRTRGRWMPTRMISMPRWPICSRTTLTSASWPGSSLR